MDMKRLIIGAAFLALGMNAGLAADTWVTKQSKSDVPTTVEKLVTAIEAAGAKVFATVDHAAGAKSIGAEMEPTVLVIFGNPKVGTPIIQADRRAGLDLPIRVLVWEENGSAMIGYEKPEALKARYGIEGADQSFEAMGGALGKLTGMAAQ
jgi:uncharacterized protein (DUF302 family)